ncbi:MAG: 1,4-alpha-glucan branching protein GlgB [Pseudomonadota bacterium]
MRNHQEELALQALIEGRHGDPFSVLGPHQREGQWVVTTFQPQSVQVELLGLDGAVLALMDRLHPAGLFEATLPPRRRRYRLRCTDEAGASFTMDDPYSFPSTLGEMDQHLLGEGTHERLYDVLGSQLMSVKRTAGTRFAVWAPNARRVSVVGNFNLWDGRRHVMRRHVGIGIWEIFIPGIGHGELYKYEVMDSEGRVLPLKSDPLAASHEGPPGNASRVYRSTYRWHDQDWIKNRPHRTSLDQPISIYEVHLGSWRRHPDGRPLSYRELADVLPAYVTELGFTHVELLPVTEHPFEGSWGYQPIGLFSPTFRWGSPDDFRHLVDALHQAGLAVIMDWVPAHFPKDDHGLRRFDGSALYEYADPRMGEHADWGTMVFNYTRTEVANYLIASALYWVEQFHIDALRVDAVASMLYLDYSREAGQWVPNEHGGNQNLAAVALLQRVNLAVQSRGAQTHAEESTAWPGVSHPVADGGLGFTAKWNMGWMNDTLSYMGQDPLYRSHHHDRMTFGLVYAFDESFVLPLSHDEVVHGKRSLLGRMPGDDWQQLASLRAYLTFMFAHPGKKLLFMGSELAQATEWNHDHELDWGRLAHAGPRGVQALVRTLNGHYRDLPALHQRDCRSEGFSWINWQDRDRSVFSWWRQGDTGEPVVCVFNFTPMVWHDYRLGVPSAGTYREMLNSDREEFGGSNLYNPPLASLAEPCDSCDHSLVLTVPPLAGLWLQPS